MHSNVQLLYLLSSFAVGVGVAVLVAKGPYSWFSHKCQETQKTIDIVAMLVSQTKEIIKILLLRVHQHGRHDVR